jgi:4,5-DOPA dioxygenase extradiol
MTSLPVAGAAPYPPVFLSHGSPMIALEPGATGAFLGRLGAAVERLHGPPRAVLAVSAHTVLPPGAAAHGLEALVLGASHHPTVHDFGGFDPRLFDLRWDAPGDPELAAQVGRCLATAGVGTRVIDRGGLDHGIWTALRHVHPQPDWPVVPLAWSVDASPQRLAALGAALAPLAAEGVWIVASGSITHDLRRVFASRDAWGSPSDDAPEIPESRAFRTWFADRAAEGDAAALLDWARRAPHGREMHPTDEHLLPWFIAAGAGAGRADRAGAMPAPRLHAAVTFGCLGMDAYAFGPSAPALAAALAPAEPPSRAA